MKTYKEYERTLIGSSDNAALVLAGMGTTNIKSEVLNFGFDGDYFAYMVTDDLEIPSYYNEVAKFYNWLRIYDDEGKTKTIYAKVIRVYRAGQGGCIIQSIG